MGKKIRQQWQNPSTTQREISHSVSYNSSKRCIQHEESLHLLWNALQLSCLCVCDAAQNKRCVCCFFFLLSSLWEKPTYYYTWPHQQTSESWSICSYDTLTAEWAPKFYNRKIKLHFLNWWFLLWTHSDFALLMNGFPFVSVLHILLIIIIRRRSTSCLACHPGPHGNNLHIIWNNFHLEQSQPYLTRFGFGG